MPKPIPTISARSHGSSTREFYLYSGFHMIFLLLCCPRCRKPYMALYSTPCGIRPPTESQFNSAGSRGCRMTRLGGVRLPPVMGGAPIKGPAEPRAQSLQHWSKLQSKRDFCRHCSVASQSFSSDSCRRRCASFHFTIVASNSLIDFVLNMLQSFTTRAAGWLTYLIPFRPLP